MPLKPAEKAALDQWYCIDAVTDIPSGMSVNRLLGYDVSVLRTTDDTFMVRRADTGETLGTRLRYGYLWITLGQPARDVLPIPEAEEDDRRLVVCGAISVKSSAPRVVENFLDMAHFPFVHTDILGAEPHTEVRHYTTEIRRDIDEVWATNCEFFQPQAALSAKEGIMTQYQYRVADPFAVLLYKTCPNAANRWDVICLFVQPVDPEFCRAHPVMFLIDDVSTVTELVAFQQVIFLQDRIILENQRPLLLPLEPRSEIPTRADASSVAYRRWLKEKGIVYGTTAQAA
ncbi:aromatic ring-hydroxylating dioxygenase subunit alpha [Aquibium carbonis]|uniref:Aromatic ring-hydroxylating dioxygenase subunit alpha n=1 Tax=Aquibium carbonis TaxID=2495581 RepID=A0A429YZK2_9HYPH|nr:aromatic ring-hydroxylating dioxygenase subunit alpha [Aquibium carbonis]RST86758.1 aromatic ring-hydroxylating dioxygenase subunit alpha [Aquibium carbonis]